MQKSARGPEPVPGQADYTETAFDEFLGRLAQRSPEARDYVQRRQAERRRALNAPAVAKAATEREPVAIPLAEKLSYARRLMRSGVPEEREIGLRMWNREVYSNGGA